MTDFTVNVPIPQVVVDTLVQTGMARNQLDALSIAGTVLNAYVKQAVLPFDLSKKWSSGDRFLVRGWNGSYPDKSKDRLGTVVRVERHLLVDDRVLVVMDDGERVIPLNTDEMRRLAK